MVFATSEILGLIPAHAGKTARTAIPRAPRWAHPRSRGENRPMTAMCAVLLGSSPLTRGKPQSSSAWSGRAWAHPRSRGENAAEETAVDIHLGSSPLTRGKRRRAAKSWRAGRLIPAHAGKTHTPMHSAMHVWAHPRSRGENTTAASASVSSWGSSPLTRGKRVAGSAAPT